MHDIRHPKVEPLSDAAVAWSYARARQLEGTLGGDPMMGVWQTTHNRVLRGWGNVTGDSEAEVAKDWSALDPSSADELAKMNRIGLYYRIWNSSDALKANERGHRVSASFRVTEKWRNPPEGRLDFTQPKSEVVGAHCLPIAPPMFYTPCPKTWLDSGFFAGFNSWGSNWGNRGSYAMRYDFFDREMFESWATVRNLNFQPPAGRGVQHVLRPPVGDLERQVLIYDIVNVEEDERLAWSIASMRRGEFHVEDVYVKPEVRRQGYGASMVRFLVEFADERNMPLRFWIPFADVDDDASSVRVRSFFQNLSFGFEPASNPSAACCAVLGGANNLPRVDVPPKPAYVFCQTNEPTVQWQSLQNEFAVSDDFVDHAMRVFAEHGETLRRLA